MKQLKVGDSVQLRGGFKAKVISLNGGDFSIILLVVGSLGIDFTIHVMTNGRHRHDGVKHEYDIIKPKKKKLVRYAHINREQDDVKTYTVIEHGAYKCIDGDLGISLEDGIECVKVKI